MLWAGLAVWLYGALQVEGFGVACAGSSDCLRYGVWCVAAEVANGRCEVVSW